MMTLMEKKILWDVIRALPWCPVSPGVSEVKVSACNAGDPGSIPES